MSSAMKRNAVVLSLCVATLAGGAFADRPAKAAPTPLLVQEGDALQLGSALAARLRRAGDRITLPAVRLADGTTVTLVLERFEVVSPELSVLVAGRASPTTATAMRAVQHFRFPSAMGARY